MMTHESPGKVLTLLAASLLSMFFMTAVAASNVSWINGSGTAIPDPFSPKNVVSVIDQAAWVYSDAIHSFLLDPAVADFSFVPNNLAFIKDSAELTIAVAVGLADPLPQVSSANVPVGQVAGAINYSPEYYDNIFSLIVGQ